MYLNFHAMATNSFQQQQQLLANSQATIEHNAAARAKAAFLRLLQEAGQTPELPDRIEGSVVSANGTLLLHTEQPPDGTDTWQVWGRCPNCGLWCWSQPCYNMAEIGAMLVSFQPEPRHLHAERSNGNGRHGG
jgi:hypothetical protein